MMNDDNFLSNFGPPPQPKLIKIDPPKHTVPDVTLLFDSNDSYLWKTSAGSKNVVELPKDKVASLVTNFATTASPNTKLATLSKKGNVFDIESLYGQHTFPTHKNFHELYHQNLKMQNSSPYQTQKVIYDPEVYRSPVLHQENETSTLISDKNINCKEQSPALKNKIPSVVPTLNTEKQFNEIKQNVLKSGKDDFTSCIKYHGYNQKYFFEDNESLKINGNSALVDKEKYDDFCKENNISLILENRKLLFNDKAVNDNAPKHKIDRHVLNILEEQKLQISQLQDVVEKVLNQQKNTADSNWKNSSSDKQCYCNYTQCPTIERENRKIAIVQTSFIENPATRTIATNTDLTMNDISLLLDNKTKINMKQNCMRKNNSLKIIHKNSNSPKRESMPSKQGNGNNFLVGKFNEQYVKETSEIIHSNDKNTNECEEYYELDIETNEHPFFGESVSNFNQKRSEEEVSSEVLHKDEINNLTCYNNIQINIQQKFLQRTEPADDPKEENLNLLNSSDLSAQQVEQQLQNFGISFLDPITLRNKGEHAPELPSPFSFCPNYQLEAAVGSHDKAIFPSRNQESPIQNWRNVQMMMMNKKYVNRNHREESSLLTSSTIQFFNKHGLKTRSCN